MTDEDIRHREAIRAVVTRYNINGDRARFAELAACFTEDGTLEWGVGSGTGRAAIAAGLSGSGATRPAGGADTSRPPITLIRHNLTTMHIELDEDRKGGKGRIYFFVVSNTGPDHAGVYVDRYALVDGEWLIAHRQARTEWTAATSVYAAAQ